MINLLLHSSVLKPYVKGAQGLSDKAGIKKKETCFMLNEEIISLRTKSSSQPVLINCLIGNTHNSPVRII